MNITLILGISVVIITLIMAIIELKNDDSRYKRLIVIGLILITIINVILLTIDSKEKVTSELNQKNYREKIENLTSNIKDKTTMNQQLSSKNLQLSQKINSWNNYNDFLLNIIQRSDWALVGEASFRFQDLNEKSTKKIKLNHPIWGNTKIKWFFNLRNHQNSTVNNSLGDSLEIRTAGDSEILEQDGMAIFQGSKTPTEFISLNIYDNNFKNNNDKFSRLSIEVYAKKDEILSQSIQKYLFENKNLHPEVIQSITSKLGISK